MADDLKPENAPKESGDGKIAPHPASAQGNQNHTGDIMGFKKETLTHIFAIVAEAGFIFWVWTEFHKCHDIIDIAFFLLCLFCLYAAVSFSILKVSERFWTAISVFVVLALTTSLTAFENYKPSSAPVVENGWMPPELPSGCKDVVIWFGGQGMTYPLQTLTNYPWGPVATSVPITKLPPNVRTNLPNLPGFSPRLREVLGIFSVTHVINGKNEDFYPILPQVISNRLYVFVKIPFTNYQRIVMSDQMDSILTNCLPQSPASWDWNYSHNQKTNAFEIVNENKNPIIQVIYKTPREVLVNGVFFVSHYDVQATFDSKYPGCFSIPNATTNVPADLFGVLLTNQFGGIFPTNPPNAGKHQLPVYQVGFGATNLIWFIVVEDVYGGFATNQKSIFKYPSNLFPGEFAE